MESDIFLSAEWRHLVMLNYEVDPAVRRREGADLRRGVVLVKEIVPRFANAMVARIFYNENYIARSMPLYNGSEEEFITEHYWGYARQRDGAIMEYRVEHPSWRVRQAGESHFDYDAANLYGAGFAEALRGKPASAFIAEGSPVVVRQGR